MSPSHYFNQGWLLISKVLQHSLVFRAISQTGQANILYNKFENYVLQLHLPGGNELTLNAEKLPALHT